MYIAEIVIIPWVLLQSTNNNEDICSLNLPTEICKDYYNPGRWPCSEVL